MADPEKGSTAAKVTQHLRAEAGSINPVRSLRAQLAEGANRRHGVGNWHWYGGLPRRLGRRG